MHDSISGYYLNPRKDMRGFIPADCRRLLDVGCGAGGFGAGLKAERKLEVWGVEPYAPAADVARRNVDNVVCSPFAAGIELPPSYFDVITFNDSLEHFPDPFPPLALAKNYLAPGGRVIASIPNVRYIRNVRHFLIDMDWEYTDEGIRDRTHLRFFTKKSIARTFDQAEYELESLQGIKPHHWSGKKMFLLRTFFGRWMEDMRYRNFVVVARPRTGLITEDR